MNVVMTWQAGAVTPGAHAAHALVPAAEKYVPEAQAVHTDEVTAAVTVLYNPAAQVVQPAVPIVSALYVPPAHAVQPAVPVASALYVPAAHAVQASEVGAPSTLLYAPAVHAVHAVAAKRPEYEPAGHGTPLYVPTCVAYWKGLPGTKLPGVASPPKYPRL